jgi:hypothetical protein
MINSMPLLPETSADAIGSFAQCGNSNLPAALVVDMAGKIVTRCLDAVPWALPPQSPERFISRRFLIG